MILAASNTKNSKNYFEFQTKGYVSGSNRIIYFTLQSKVTQSVVVDWDYDNAGTNVQTYSITSTLTPLSKTFTGGFSGYKKVHITCERPSEIFTVGLAIASSFQDSPAMPSNLGYFNGLTSFLCGSNKYTSIDLRPLFKLTTLHLSSNIDYGTNYTNFLPQTASDGSGGIPDLDLRFTPYVAIVRAVSCGINTITLPENNNMTLLNIIGNNITTPINYLSSALTTLYVARASLNSTKLPLSMLPASLTLLALGNGGNGIINSTGAVENSFPACNLSHLTNLVTCWINNCGITSLTLPSTNSMTDLRVYNNTTGNLNSELVKVPNLTSILLGRNTSNTVSNNLGALDLSANTLLQTVDCSWQDVTSITLPSNNTMTSLTCFSNTITSFNHLSTSLITLLAYDNLLTSSVMSQVLACTSLTNLQLGSFSSALGQGGNTMGNNLDVSALTSLTTLDLTACGLTGSLTLPSTNTIVNLYLDGNTGLTSLNRIPTSVSVLRLGSVALTSLPTLPTGLTDFRFLNIGGSATFNIDLSSNTTNFSLISVQNARLTGLTLPVGKSIANFVVLGNSSLSSIGSLTSCDFPDSANNFYAYQCNLDVTFPLGTSPNGIKIRNIRIYQNDMSLANVNATVDNLYSNRANFNNNNIAKTLQMQSSATNHQARPSGTLQMPSGFSYGVSDGTPASQMEKIWVLVNQNVDGDTSASSTYKKYKWTVTVSNAVTISTLLNNGGNLRIQLANSTGITRNVGQRITITNSSEASYNGTWVIASKVSNSDYTLTLSFVSTTATGQVAS